MTLLNVKPTRPSNQLSPEEFTMNETQYKTIDKFDRMMGALHDLPDVTRAKPSTVVCTLPIIGASQTFIIQTFRQREIGDTIFLQYVDDGGSVRIAIPPAAANAIARQREALTEVEIRNMSETQSDCPGRHKCHGPASPGPAE